MAKQQENKEQSGAKKHLVVNPFNDINDFSIVYSVGDDVSHLDAERLAKLIELGLVS